MNSPPSFCVEYEISSKLKHLPFFFQNYGLKDDRCQHWQVPRMTENYCHQWIQHLQIVDYAKFRGKRLTSFPVPRSPLRIPCPPFSVPHSTFPFLKIASKEVSNLYWQNRYPNLKTTCHINLKFFLWTKLLDRLLLAKYVVSVNVTLKSKIMAIWKD